jgi:hypothetical protein
MQQSAGYDKLLFLHAHSAPPLLSVFVGRDAFLRRSRMSNRMMAILFLAYGTASIAKSEDLKPSVPSGEHDFGNKVVTISFRTNENKGVSTNGVLEKARIRKFGDQCFLIGTVPDLGEDYKKSKGIVIWIAVANIVQIVEYDNLDAAREVLEEAAKPRIEK